MKSIHLIAALQLCTAAGAFAQKQGDALPYNKEHLDSLFRQFQSPGTPFVLPAPNGKLLQPGSNHTGQFEALNPGATVINKTAAGTVYNMPLDNMPVLVPDLNSVEKMPGSRDFRQAPGGNMPNPLYKSPSQKK